MFCCENEMNYQSTSQGSISYYHENSKNELKTNNYFCKLDDNLEILKSVKVDTSAFDCEPKWNFVGLEDARIVYWDNKYYICGVRRDTTTTGVGRMELSEIDIDFDNNKVTEISRSRIEVEKYSYCEKNWMPIVDSPYSFVKWTNPTEIVKVNTETFKAETIFSYPEKFETKVEIRGGSNVIKWIDEQYICIVHDVEFGYDYKNTRMPNIIIVLQSSIKIIHLKN